MKTAIFHCPFLGANVDLTSERIDHIRTGHPEFGTMDIGVMIQTIRMAIEKPSIVVQSRKDAAGIYPGKVGGRIVWRKVRDRDPHRLPRTKLGDYGFYFPLSTERKHFMDAGLTFHYDRVGDILSISKCEPYLGQESEMLEDEIVVRLNPKTNAVENLEILFFSKRMEQTSDWKIPVLAELRLAA